MSRTGKDRFVALCLLLCVGANLIPPFYNLAQNAERIVISYDDDDDNNNALQLRTPVTTTTILDVPNNNTVTLDKQRILIAVASYKVKTYDKFEIMFDAYRDLCESGAVVDLVVYTAKPWPLHVLQNLNARGTCRNANGALNVSIRIKSKKWKEELVKFHRSLFYESLSDYDLFIYTEDDLLIRPAHVISFLDETRKLRDTVGDAHFTDYSIGFLRYEVQREKEKQRVVYEFKWELKSRQAFDDQHVIHVPDSNQTYFNGGSSGHQGMYMATPRQLLAWKDRLPNCHFSNVSADQGGGIRERISSLHLYDKAGCNVTQLIPTDSYQDFLIHHVASHQHEVLHKYLPRGVTFDTVSPLSISYAFPRRGEQNYSGVRMYDDEHHYTQDRQVNLTDYARYTSSGAGGKSDVVTVAS